MYYILYSQISYGDVKLIAQTERYNVKSKEFLSVIQNLVIINVEKM